MRTVALAALGLIACDKGEPPKPVPIKPPTPQVPADAESHAILPPSSRASIASPPRDQWACGFDVQEDQGIHEIGHALYTLGKRDHCLLPLSLVAQGIWGCPDAYVRTDESDHMQREHALTYDDHDRVASFLVQVREDFSWDGLRLMSTSRTQFGETETATYRDRGDEVLAIDDKGQTQELLTLVGTQVIRYDEYVYGREAGAATIEWRGGRPQRVEIEVLGPVRGHVTRTFRYDCDHQ